jgi:hypothetical protein
VSVIFYAGFAMYGVIDFMASPLSEGYKSAFIITLMIGWIPLLIVVGRICGVLFGYKKKPRTKKHLLIRIWRKFWDI